MSDNRSERLGDFTPDQQEALKRQRAAFEKGETREARYIRRKMLRPRLLQVPPQLPAEEPDQPATPLEPSIPAAPPASVTTESLATVVEPEAPTVPTRRGLMGRAVAAIALLSALLPNHSRAPNLPSVQHDSASSGEPVSYQMAEGIKKRLEQLNQKNPDLYRMSITVHELLDDRLGEQVDKILLTFMDQKPTLNPSGHTVEYRNNARQMLQVSQYHKDGVGDRYVFNLRFTPGPWVPDFYMDRQIAADGRIIHDQVTYTLDRNKNLTSTFDRSTKIFSKDELKDNFNQTCKLKPQGEIRWDPRQEFQEVSGSAVDRKLGIPFTCHMSPKWLDRSSCSTRTLLLKISLILLAKDSPIVYNTS